MKDPLKQTRYYISETDFRRIPEAQAEVVFIGRSNVGKSSAICALCENKKLARVSKLPGRTRAINVFEVRRGIWLVDLPGFGYAMGPIKEKEYWPKMIAGYLTGRPNLKLVFFLIDAELGVGANDLSQLRWMRDNNIPCILIGSKVDRLSFSRQNEYRSKMAASMGLQHGDIHWISAKKKYGIKALRQEVLGALEIK